MSFHKKGRVSTPKNGFTDPKGRKLHEKKSISIKKEQKREI